MKSIISVFGITNGIGHTHSSFNAFSVSTSVSTKDVMQSQHVSRNPEISNVKQVFGILIMEEMSVCKVGAALFLPSPILLSQITLYFLTLQIRHKVEMRHPSEPCDDSLCSNRIHHPTKQMYTGILQSRPSGSAPWICLGSLGCFNIAMTLTSPRRDCGTQRSLGSFQTAAFPQPGSGRSCVQSTALQSKQSEGRLVLPEMKGEAFKKA